MTAALFPLAVLTLGGAIGWLAVLLWRAVRPVFGSVEGG